MHLSTLFHLLVLAWCSRVVLVIAVLVQGCSWNLQLGTCPSSSESHLQYRYGIRYSLHFASPLVFHQGITVTMSHSRKQQSSGTRRNETTDTAFDTVDTLATNASGPKRKRNTSNSQKRKYTRWDGLSLVRDAIHFLNSACVSRPRGCTPLQRSYCSPIRSI